MCKCKDCPGHQNAPSKTECRACFGVNYPEWEDEENEDEPNEN